MTSNETFLPLLPAMQQATDVLGGVTTTYLVIWILMFLYDIFSAFKKDRWVLGQKKDRWVSGQRRDTKSKRILHMRLLLFINAATNVFTYSIVASTTFVIPWYNVGTCNAVMKSLA